MPKNAQTLLKLPEPKPTGNPFLVDKKNPATVPIPQAVIITKIEGAYTEKDRKLWVFLVHAVWDELLEKRLHEIPVSKINRLFVEHGGDSSSSWIWDSAKRLSRTVVEWEQDDADGSRLQGVSNLLNAVLNKNARISGRLKFEIPALLSEVIHQPSKFSRLRLHFMIGLSGKYAVTLYELLESAANMKNPVLDVPLGQLRQWLKVPDGKLGRYIDLKRYVIDPALKQINENPEGAGFSVTVEPVKEGRAVERLRFVVSKSAGRLADEKGIKEPRPIAAAEPKGAADKGDYDYNFRLSTDTYERARKAAPKYDIYALESEWRAWIQKNSIKPNSPDAAFVGFCRNRQQKKPLS